MTDPMNIVSFAINLILSTAAVAVAAYLLPGVHVDTLTTALLVAVVLGLLNAFLEPVLLLLTLPVNLMTLGLFTFVVIAAMVLLTAAVVPGFRVDGFWWALAFALILSVVSSILGMFKPKPAS
jgi:putative membrane protein